MIEPLWITYAWKDDEGGDFSYLVQELIKNHGFSGAPGARALITGTSPARRSWGARRPEIPDETSMSRFPYHHVISTTTSTVT